MLYVTTRNKTDSFTAYRALREGFAPDGGQFAPIRLPAFTQEQMDAFRGKTFCDAAADILNIFFSAHLTGWDVEFAIGRRPVKLVDIGRKITVAEFWHNSDQTLQYSLERVYKLLCGNDPSAGNVQGWASVAIRIAFLFGTFSELCREGKEITDISVAGQDFEAVISVWYARKMGLPIAMIICGTNDNCGVWDLLHKGQFDTGAAVIPTDAAKMDQSTPLGIERLIYETLGIEENLCYLQKQSQKGIYHVPSDLRSELSGGMLSSVVGKKRVRDLIGSVYHTHKYLIDPYMAVAYGALQDYRAKYGENRTTLMLGEESACKHAKLIGSITGLSEKDISNR